MDGGMDGLGRLLDEVRPCLASGWSSAPIGLGEIAVGNSQTGCYAVLPEEMAPLLPLLDGRHSLDELSAALLERTGQVRHRALFEAVGTLAFSGLLEPLPRTVAHLFPSASPGRLKSLGKVGFLALMLPVRLRRVPDAIRSPGSTWLPALLLLLPAAAAALLALGVWPLGRPCSFEDLVWTVAGVAGAASLRELARLVQLRRLGCAVRGLGLRLTLLVPHFGLCGPDEVMLSHSHRVTYRLWNLAVPAAAGSAAVLAGGIVGSVPLRLLGIGALLAFLIDLSPLWRSDLVRLLGELVGFRSLRRRSVSFLLRRLWHSVLRSRRPGREELALIWSSSAAVLFLFGVAGVLWALLPASLEVLTDAVLASERGLVARLLAGAIAAALALALLLALGSILASVAALVYQLLWWRRGRPGRGVETMPDAGSTEALARDLSALPPFSELPLDLVRDILARARHTSWSAGTSVIVQGDAGEVCYVIRSGICSVVREAVDGRSREVARLGPGLVFGETALLLGVPRQATVRAVSAVTLVEIPRDLFLDLVRRSGNDPDPLLERIRLRQYLASQPFLAGARPESLAALANDATAVEARAGDTLISAGEPGNDLFILQEGRCEVTAPDGTPVARLGPDDHFGEIALLTGRPRSAGVRCLSDCRLIRIPAASYQALLTREFSAGLKLDIEVEARLQELELA